jgi:hypothetical protein
MGHGKMNTTRSTAAGVGEDDELGIDSWRPAAIPVRGGRGKLQGHLRSGRAHRRPAASRDGGGGSRHTQAAAAPGIQRGSGRLLARQRRPASSAAAAAGFQRGGGGQIRDGFERW